MLIEEIYRIIDNDIKNAYFHIRVILNAVKNKLKKQVVARILYMKNNPPDSKQNLDQF